MPCLHPLLTVTVLAGRVTIPDDVLLLATYIPFRSADISRWIGVPTEPLGRPGGGIDWFMFVGGGVLSLSRHQTRVTKLSQLDN